jgi:enolase
MEQAETIARVRAREVLDSRGNPTVEVEVHCHGGAWGRAIVPSGASTGRHEAVELRDGDPARYGGKGVLRAIGHVREHIAPRVIGLAVTEQALIDRTLCQLDGTADKSRLGANAILGVSLACAQAAAAARRQPLWRYLEVGNEAHMPLPMVNLISGGLHAGRNLDVQDFLLLPIGAASFVAALEMSVNVYRALGVTLVDNGFDGVLVGDEGGFGPRLRSNEQALEIVVRAIERAGCIPGRDAAVGLDVAGTHFYQDEHYHLKELGGSSLSSQDMISLLTHWTKAYPIVSIEDGLAEDDWEGWRDLTQALGKRVQLIGDDLFATNPARLQRGITAGVGNSVLVKLNQIGTLTETLQVIRLARSAGYRTVISARSGETEDTTIADLAVATGAGQIKIGSVVRGERLAKYNQLLRVDEQMGDRARFAGWQPPDQ